MPLTMNSRDAERKKWPSKNYCDVNCSSETVTEQLQLNMWLVTTNSLD